MSEKRQKGKARPISAKIDCRKLRHAAARRLDLVEPQHEIAARQMSGGGTLVAFDLGSQDAAFRFLNALQIVDISNNLGDAKSMATHPCTTTHRALSEAQQQLIGLTRGWVRLSVGLEGETDLARDISRALDAA